MALVRRVAAEFAEVPGLRLTLAQAATFFGVAPEVCSRILACLMEEGYLRLTADGRYVNRSATFSRLASDP